MRVTFDGTIFGLQRVGGISTYAIELARRLAVAEDIALTLWLPKSLRLDRASELTALPTTHRREALSSKIARYLPLGAKGADIVHSVYYRTPRDRHAKTVVTVYDFIYERYRSGLPALVHSYQKRRACRVADAIITISTNTAHDLCAAYPDVDPARVFTIPLAASTQTFYPPPTAGRRAELADTVLFVGQRKGYKRFDLAVAAVGEARGLRLAIVGSPPNAEEIGMLDRWLRGRWTALGRVTDAELRNIYAGAFAVICPSDYEGFGLPILEAQACGCPTVVANRSSFPEVGGTAALYALDQAPGDYAAALGRLTENDVRAQIVAAGIANAATFSWDRTCAMTIDCYRRVMAE